jgi:kynureninase
MNDTDSLGSSLDSLDSLTSPDLLASPESPDPPASLDARATSLDAANPLRHCRERFLLPEGTAYLDGNSLGALAAAVPAAVDDAVRRQWGSGLIGSWFGEDAAWWNLPLRLGDRVGELLGAAAGQCVVGDSTSVQIFNTLVAAARLRSERDLLLTDAGHFPTDAYLADSVGELLGLEVRRITAGELPAVLAAEGARVAVAAFPAVDFATGERWDVPGARRARWCSGTCATRWARWSSRWTSGTWTSRSAAPINTSPADRAPLRSYTRRAATKR